VPVVVGAEDHFQAVLGLLRPRTVEYACIVYQHIQFPDNVPLLLIELLYTGKVRKITLDDMGIDFQIGVVGLEFVNVFLHEGCVPAG